VFLLVIHCTPWPRQVPDSLYSATSGSGSGNYPAGTLFNVGVTTVTFKVAMVCSNTVTCTFTISVYPPPVVTWNAPSIPLPTQYIYSSSYTSYGRITCKWPRIVARVFFLTPLYLPHKLAFPYVGILYTTYTYKDAHGCANTML